MGLLRPALATAVWSGCVAPTPFPTAEQRWNEVSLSAQGDARIQTELLRETHLDREGSIMGTRVLRTVGEVHVGSAEPLRFDSSLPRPADPWILRWQHAVTSVAARVRLDAQGRPVSMVDPDAWRQTVDAAVASLPRPPGGPAPLDAQQFVDDLGRTFPGRPPLGDWRRPGVLAGVSVHKDETCAPAGRRDGGELWRCDGICRARSEAGPQLHETECWTEVWFDRGGLLGVESGYSGTRVWLEGGLLADAPIAGQRLVVRTEDP